MISSTSALVWPQGRLYSWSFQNFPFLDLLDKFSVEAGSDIGWLQLGNFHEVFRSSVLDSFGF